MGRPRKPQLDLVLQGTARPDRMAAQGRVSEPDLLALTDAPPPPKGLSREAGAHWRQQATLLVARRVLTEGDLVALEAWSRAAGLLCQADREIQRDGILVAGPRGGRYPHPAIGVRRAAAAEVYRWTAAFGVTPAARPNVGRVAERSELEDDAWAEFARQPRRGFVPRSEQTRAT